jgi:hypothetical protein
VSDFIDKMTKPQMRAYFEGKIAVMEKDLAFERKNVQASHDRTVEAERALEEERALSEGETDRAAMLETLVQEFEAVVPVPDMTGDQYDVVREAMALAVRQAE